MSAVIGPINAEFNFFITGQKGAKRLNHLGVSHLAWYIYLYCNQFPWGCWVSLFIQQPPGLKAPRPITNKYQAWWDHIEIGKVLNNLICNRTFCFTNKGSYADRQSKFYMH